MFLVALETVIQRWTHLTRAVLNAVSVPVFSKCCHKLLRLRPIVVGREDVALNAKVETDPVQIAVVQ